MTSKNSTTSEFFDLTFSNEAASNYILLLEIDALELKACWFHQSKNLITGFATYLLTGVSIKDSIQQLFVEHPFLNSVFDQLIITVKTDNYALTPNEISEEKALEYFTLTNEFDSDTQSTRAHQLIGVKSRIVYGINLNLIETLQESFSHKTIVPHVAPQIEAELNRLKKAIIKTMAVIHIWEGTLDVRLYQDGNLLMSNSFFQTGSEDVVYYLLYCAEVCGLDPNEVMLEVSGKVEIGDPCWKLLSNYWNRLELAPSLVGINISEKLDNRSKASYDFITNSLLCAS